jgi:hypothetical protein
MSDPDPAAAYERLRTETAAMLRLNLADLTLTEGLQLDLVALLRLEIDSLQGAALSGETVDLQRLAAAHGMLQKMLPERALVASAPPAEPRFGPTARQRLRELIERTVLREDPPEVEAERAWRDEMQAVAGAGGDVAEVAKPAPFLPASEPATAPSPPPPPKPMSDIERMNAANSKPIPSHYLRDFQQLDEPWRAWTHLYI